MIIVIDLVRDDSGKQQSPIQHDLCASMSSFVLFKWILTTGTGSNDENWEKKKKQPKKKEKEKKESNRLR